MLPVDSDDDESGEYIPSPEEIRAACLEIQSGWSAKERARRETMSRWVMPGMQYSERFERDGEADDEVRQSD